VRRLLVLTLALGVPLAACSLITGVANLEEVGGDGGACGQGDERPSRDGKTADRVAPDAADSSDSADAAFEGGMEPIVCEAGLMGCGASCVALDLDPSNCGACGHDCLGGGCSAGTCQPVVLATVTNPIGLAVGATDVYVVSRDDSYVAKVPIGGGTPVTFATSEEGPRHVVVGAKEVFWGDEYSGLIRRANLDGTGIATVASGQRDPWDVAVDSTHVYWANGGPVDGGASLPGVASCPFAGCASTTTVSATPGQTGRGILLIGSDVYWAEAGGAAIYECPKAGCPGAGPTLVASSQASVQTLATDGKHLFWQDDGVGSLMTCALSSCSPQALATGISTEGLANTVAVDSSRVYWSDQATGDVYACSPTSCTTPAVLASSQGAVVGVAVDAVAVYWVTYSAMGAVTKLAK
jgi:hypothetical protein